MPCYCVVPLVWKSQTSSSLENFSEFSLIVSCMIFRFTVVLSGKGQR